MKPHLFAAFALSSALFTIALDTTLVAHAMPIDEVTNSRNPKAKEEPDRRPLSDEDILNPKKLRFDVKVPFLDSFDQSQKGYVFISKRSIVGSPDKERGGVFGEVGSELYQQHCLFICPNQTTDIDATYVYVFEIKSECKIGTRAIGWTELQREWQGGIFTGSNVVVGQVHYTSQPNNIDHIFINGKRVNMRPAEAAQLPQTPYGTNYKYFPRNKVFGVETSTANSSDLSAGFITDLHYFPAQALVSALKANPSEIIIQFPSWQPSQQVISGDALEELKSLASNCEDEEERPAAKPLKRAPLSKKR